MLLTLQAEAGERVIVLEVVGSLRGLDRRLVKVIEVVEIHGLVGEEEQYCGGGVSERDEIVS